MANSIKTISRQSARPVAGGIHQSLDQPDLIEREFLELWLGISRLRERVLGRGNRKPMSARKRKAAAGNRRARGRPA